MAILMILDLEGATTDEYEAVNATMGVDADHLPEGLISHAVGPTDGGLLIVDVWESEGDLDRFFQRRVGPAMAQVGVESQASPRVHPVYNRIDRGRGRQPNVIVLIDSEGFGPADYDTVTGRMDAHRGDGSGHPAASHVAAVTDGGMVFVDLWDSPESAGRFFEEQIGPAATDVDLGELEPRFVPVHNRFVARG